jgi:hypothetical protein
VPNTGDAVVVLSGGNVIGGTETNGRNVISGNGQAGISLTASTATANTIQGNLVGVGPDGSTARANDVGVLLQQGANANIVGGTTPAEGNVISANRTGVHMNGPSSDNRVEGNLVGTDSSGSVARGNTTASVQVNGEEGNRIGGMAAGAENVIAHTTAGPGVALDTAARRTEISSNKIFSNSALGIDLGSDGVTANDPLDADTGANDRQNYPVLSTAESGGGRTRVVGALDSAASQAYRLEFFSSPSCDPAQHGEGEVYLGSHDVTTDSSGNAAFSATLARAANVGHVVTATATDASGNTSEFSRVSDRRGGTSWARGLHPAEHRQRPGPL